MENNNTQKWPEKEKYSGMFQGKNIKFNRVWSDYRFSDEECEALLSGAEIKIRPKSKKTGKEYDCYGRLKEQEYNGHTFYGFVPEFDTKRIPDTFNGHLFSDEEKKKLQDGETLYLVDLLSRKSGQNYAAWVRFNSKDGMQMAFGAQEEE